MDVVIFCILDVVGFDFFFGVVVILFGFLIVVGFCKVMGEVLDIIFVVFLFFVLFREFKFDIIGRIVFLKDFVFLFLEGVNREERFEGLFKVEDRLVGVGDVLLFVFFILLIVFICSFRGSFGFDFVWKLFLILGLIFGEGDMDVNLLLLFDGILIFVGFVFLLVKLENVVGIFCIWVCGNDCVMFLEFVVLILFIVDVDWMFKLCGILLFCKLVSVWDFWLVCGVGEGVLFMVFNVRVIVLLFKLIFWFFLFGFLGFLVWM